MRFFTQVDGRRRPRLPLLLVLVGFSLVNPAMWLFEAGTVAWPWFVGNALLAALVLGPFARSSVGRAIEDRADRLGSAGKVILVATVAVGILTAVALWRPDVVPLGSAIVGGILAALAVDLFERWQARSTDGT